MTPYDIDIVRSDLAAIDPDELATEFYSTLFDLAPDVRALFPADMAEQRRKLMSELGALIELGTAVESARAAEFVDRAHRLGRRHVRYGTEGAHYALVGAALLSALRQVIDGFDDAHEHAWTVLYTTVADTMREGAADASLDTTVSAMR